MSRCDFAVKRIRHYIYGTNFTVVTDHSSLRQLQKLKKLEGRLACWALCLKGYNFTIIHQAGAQHQNADGLSQMPILALHPAKSDHLYKVLAHPEAWESEKEETRGALKKLSANTSVCNGQLMKMVN